MRFKLIFTAVIFSLASAGSLLVVIGCGGDDDDSGDDDTSDFDDDTSYTIPDDDTGEPTQGGACGCSGCSGCEAAYSVLAMAYLTEDFEGLHPEYGADELGYYLDSELDRLHLSECEVSCFDDMLSGAVECVDNGLNCLFACDDAGCMQKCGKTLSGCLDSGQGSFSACLAPCDGSCGDYVNCAAGCEAEGLTPNDAARCANRCMDAYEACSPLFGITARARCFADMQADFSAVSSLEDILGLYQEYASCVQ
jgi:hypothetical protein